MDRWCVVTTVGTSLLSNCAKEKGLGLNGLLRDAANESREELARRAPETLKELSRLAEQVQEAALQAQPHELKKMSAELNGLVSLYGQRLYDKSRRALDTHYLVATDTFLGGICADILATLLRELGFVTVARPEFPGLSTKNYRAFSQGVSQLVEWCGRELPLQREHNYRVIFNLVGSFKSLQAYMNTLGMFYADEIIYIFEAADAELIRIPRLPVKWSELEVLETNLAQFGLLAHGVTLDKYKVEGIPEILLAPADGDRVRLSDWGRVVWDQHSKDLLAAAKAPLELRGLAYKLTYEPSFLSDFGQLQPRERAQVQEALLTVATALHTGGVDRLREDPGLQCGKLESSKHASQPLWYFRVTDDLRVTCVQHKSELRLRRVGHHDKVLPNP